MLFGFRTAKINRYPRVTHSSTAQEDLLFNCASLGKHMATIKSYHVFWNSDGLDELKRDKRIV